MISNTIPYCNKYLNPNETLYVEIRNDCAYYIYMYLNYTVNSKRFSKQSPVFAPDKFQRLTFPSGSLNVIFKVFNCEQKPPGILCTKNIPNYISSCYKITGPSLGHITCVQVPC